MWCPYEAKTRVKRHMERIHRDAWKTKAGLEEAYKVVKERARREGRREVVSLSAFLWVQGA